MRASMDTNYEIVFGLSYEALDEYRDKYYQNKRKIKFIFNIKEYNQTYEELKRWFDPQYIVDIFQNLTDDKPIIIHVSTDECKILNLPNGYCLKKFISFYVNHHCGVFNKSYAIYHWVEIKVLDGIKTIQDYNDFRSNGYTVLTLTNNDMYSRKNRDKVVEWNVPELGFMKAEKVFSLCSNCSFAIHSEHFGPPVHCAVNPHFDRDCTYACRDYELSE
jgi:hypothetical protein